MGFIDCLSLARALSAQPRPSNCRAIPKTIRGRNEVNASSTVG